MKLNYPKVSIIVLNWNGKEDTIECLESLKHIDYPNYELIVVDNASTDGSVECFQKINANINLIVNNINLGYSEGNNIGIERAIENHSDYVLILNNDTVVDSKFLTELVNVAESDNRIGIVGPKTYYYEPDNVIYYAGGKINWYTGQPSHIGQKRIDDGQFNEIISVDFVAGSCMLIRIEVIKRIGKLPNEYFLLWEDIDYSVRAQRNGYKLLYAPLSKIWHKESISIKKIKSQRVYYSIRNRLILYKKYSTKKQLFCSLICFCLYYLPVIMLYVSIKSKDINVMKYAIKGMKDGLK